MKIGILGSGNVGGTLGKRWAKNGHTVIFSSRKPDSDEMKKLVADAGPSASAATVADTAKNSEVILLSPLWNAAQEILTAAGDLTGKLLIDVLNPLLPDLSGLAVGTTTSAGEMVAQWAPGARVVKAFNTVGFNIMADPKLGGSNALLFYCGDDAEAKKIVHGLATELDFDARDAGPLVKARLLEPFALLWISLAFTKGHGREFAFQTIQR
jgi:8-hydroxy-5-deazaflavin:NADPH oxidoreductase